jgi:glycosyltransferase involved in cell wall biosynthesis
MKIAYVNYDDGKGGAAIACLRLADALNKTGQAEVEVLVQQKKNNHPKVKALLNGRLGKGKAFARFVLERLYFLFFEKNKSVRFAFSVAKFGTAIGHTLKLAQYDIIHLHWINFGLLSLSDLKQILALNKPVVWTMHDMWPFTGGCHYSNACENYQNACGSCKEYLKNPSANDLSFRILNQKKQILQNHSNLYPVGCSQWLTEKALRSSLFSKLSLTAIPNTIDQRVFFPLNKCEAKTKLGLDVTKTHILFVAMNVEDKRKGFVYLKEALLHLKETLDQQSLPHPELTIIGKVKTEILAEVPFKTNYLGSIYENTKLNLVYNSADLFVTPSLQDNLPNTLMEALATGTPCVGFKIGGIPEMIDHQKNGYLAEHTSSKSLADGLFWGLENSSNPDLRKAAIEKVNQNYAEPIVAAQYLALYERALREKVK